MNMRLLLLLPALLQILAIPVPCRAQQPEPRFRRLSVENGLSHSAVQAILQDRRGFMWFSTNDGLNRYDGHSFKVFSKQPDDFSSLSNALVSALHEDHTGTLWVGTFYGDINRFDGEKETFIRYNGSESPETYKGVTHIWAIYEDGNGTLWLGTDKGLKRYDREADVFTAYTHDPSNPRGLAHNDVRAIAGDKQGGLWIGTAGGGLDKMDRQTGTFTHHTHDPANPESIGDNTPLVLFTGAAGELWIGTAGGDINCLKPGARGFSRYPSAPAAPGGNASPAITAIYEDRRGTLWFGTQGGGLLTLDRESRRFTVYRNNPCDPFSLGNNSVLAIYEDPSGILWFGTGGGGIDILDPYMNIFNAYGNEEGKTKSGTVTGFYEGRDGSTWLSTWQHGLKRFNRRTGTLEVFSGTPGRGADAPGCRAGLALCGDDDDNLWMGTPNCGLVKIEPHTKMVTVYTNRPTPDNSPDITHYPISSLVLGSGGYIWVGTQGGGLYKFDPGRGTFTGNYRSNPSDSYSLGDDYIQCLYEDSGGRLWMGTAVTGLNLFNRETGTFHRYLVAGPKSVTGKSFQVTQVLEGRSHRRGQNRSHRRGQDRSHRQGQGRSHTLWVSTVGAGLQLFSPPEGKFTESYTIEDGLPHNTVMGILEDGRGRLWLSTNRGIARFDPGSRIFKSYGLSSGLQGYSFYGASCYKSKRGEFFFGGSNGFNSFYPDLLDENRTVPPLVFTGLKIAYRPVLPGAAPPLEGVISRARRLTLPYSRDPVTFEFAALDYSAPGENNYRYQLEGYRDGWTALGNRREVTFGNLAPGSYVLKVSGSNSEGTWNREGISLTLVIEPLFWQTFWFRGLFVLALLLLLWSWHKSRLKRAALRLKTESEMARTFQKFNISAREQEILHLILRGRSNKDIEDELFIAMPTVKSHIYSIFRKTGVKNRLELINLFQRTTGPGKM